MRRPIGTILQWTDANLKQKEHKSAKYFEGQS